jgi:DNA-binding NtrC family response regulator
MKKDVTELKKMFFDIIQNPSLQTHVPVYSEDNSSAGIREFQPLNANYNLGGAQQVVIKHDPQTPIQHHEEVEESLSIIDKEKELIIKALKKHRGKRRDASVDLGISERTLYRKLKEYDIEHL